jgi:UDP-N-acetylmuramate--alanine ligase
MRAPQDTGIIHFIGIGGIGMSGIAEVLASLGYQVRGSDLSESANVVRLREKGIAVEVGHRPENVDGAAVVVYSSAVKRDNPEMAAARQARLPVVRRAEMLAELMRLKSSIAVGGTHGKTTTTSLVGQLLDAGNMDPTVINGGIINAYGTNARMGAGDWMVVEADESDGTFVKLPAQVAIVTNMDPEHLDHYGDFDAIRTAFVNFVENVPFYGFAVMCIDDPDVRVLVGQIEDRPIITYGQNPQADVQVLDVVNRPDGVHFNIVMRGPSVADERRIDDLRLPMPGLHNALNATAALAVADRLGVSADDIRSGLDRFSGVKRRFTRTGEWQGVTIFDDYGHHPVEISAVLGAARAASHGRVIAVMQPHRYSRLQSLFEEFCGCFDDADTVIIADVHAAGESPIPGIGRDALIDGLRTRGHRDVRGLDDHKDLAGLIAEIAQPDDFVLCLGAGSITQWAHDLPGQLGALG